MRVRAVTAAWPVVLLCLLTPLGARAGSLPGGGVGGAVPVEAPAPGALGVGGLPLLSGEPYHPTVPGTRARLLGAWAYAPQAAPPAVQAAVWAANDLQASPYIYGGGHATWVDRGYDCSGSVSYALHAGALLDSPMASGELEGWGVRGRGRWITVYANADHTFMVIAGLRLDTSRYTTQVSAQSGPRWRVGPRPFTTFVARHAAGL